jgi:mRNA interferase MazF
MADTAPHRSEVWQVDLDPVRGHEQGHRRPAVIVSADIFNAGPAQLVVVCPITSRHRQIPSHVTVMPPEGGLRVASYVICEQIRTVSTERLMSRLGELGPASMSAIEERLRILLDL